MLGAIIGDIVGSRFEFNNYRKKDFKFFHRDCDFTDDTICTVAVADWLLNPTGNLSDTMRKWCRSYPSSYGGMFKRWIQDEDMGPYNSFGNGAAMRVSPVGWYFKESAITTENAIEKSNQIFDLAEATASITHDHPEGIKGAQCVAASIFALRGGYSKYRLKELIKFSFKYNLDLTCDWIRRVNTFDETCQVTVPQAIIAFLESTSFEDAIRLAVSIGGDSDTIAAITGSLAEAHYGIHQDIIDEALTYLPEDMIQIINKLNSHCHAKL